MAQRKQTPISGITTTSTYEDGDAYSLVNLRPKNGALHPVTPRKVEQTLSRQYDIIFIHKNNDYENWVGVVNSANSATVYWDVKSASPQVIAQVDGVVGSMQQIGNTLSLVASDNVSYLLFQNGNYRYLGELPQVPVIALKTTKDAEFYMWVDLYDEYGDLWSKTDGFENEIKGTANKLMDRLVNGYTDGDKPHVDGFGPMLFDAHFIRYAFRLFDGTLTKHSPPILVVPTVVRVPGQKPSNPAIGLKTIEFFSGSTIENGSEHAEIRVHVRGYKVSANYDSNLGGDWALWEDIIKSVDVFMSAPLGFANVENLRNDLPQKWQPTDGGDLIFTFVDGITPEIEKNVTETSSFYFVRELPIGRGDNLTTELPADVATISDEGLSDMKNLIYQEIMSDDQLSNHKYGAAVSYLYNSRLHLADTKTVFFNGFNLSFFQWWSYRFGANGTVDLPTIDAPVTLITEVEILVGNAIERVYASFESNTNPYLNSSGFLSYPDPRARRITIYQVDKYDASFWERRFTAALTPHKFLNLAYCTSDNFTLITGDDLGDYSPRDTSKAVTLSEPNKLKVSELNNPLIFPVVNTYQIGDGAIVAMATNAMNVSDRNYGQYPLYVFTTSGIWALNVGSGEVAYSTLSAPVSVETPISSIVAETPYGVIFAAHRGLMRINGQSVDFISPQLEEVPVALNIEMNGFCDGVVFAPEHRRFAELLKNLRDMIYDPYEDELIVNTGADLNYVLNFQSRSFWQSNEKIDLSVKNAYPELFIVGGNQLKNYASAQTPSAHIGLITRPLQFGTHDIKRLERMVLRGIMYDLKNTGEGKHPLFMLHHSMDGVNFNALTGRLIQLGNHRDLDSGLLARAKSSRFVFSFAGVVNEKTKLIYLDSVFDKEYDNTKMR